MSSAEEEMREFIQIVHVSYLLEAVHVQLSDEWAKFLVLERFG